MTPKQQGYFSSSLVRSKGKSKEKQRKKTLLWEIGQISLNCKIVKQIMNLIYHES